MKKILVLLAAASMGNEGYAMRKSERVDLSAYADKTHPAPRVRRNIFCNPPVGCSFELPLSNKHVEIQRILANKYHQQVNPHAQKAAKSKYATDVLAGTSRGFYISSIHVDLVRYAANNQIRVLYRGDIRALAGFNPNPDIPTQQEHTEYTELKNFMVISHCDNVRKSVKTHVHYVQLDDVLFKTAA